jgi:hypothetical protein
MRIGSLLQYCLRFAATFTSEFGPSRQAAFFGPTVANGALRTWLDLPPVRASRE